MSMNINELRDLKPTDFWRLTTALLRQFKNLTADTSAQFIEKQSSALVRQPDEDGRLLFHCKVDDMTYASVRLDFEESALVLARLEYIPVGYLKKKRARQYYQLLESNFTNMESREILLQEEPLVAAKAFRMNGILIKISLDEAAQTGHRYVSVEFKPAE